MVSASPLQPLPNLPIPLTSLVGRDHEVAAACSVLRRSGVRLLSLTGPGGVGKTRLALEVASALGGDFVDGVVFVQLAAIRDPAHVLPAVARARGVREPSDRPLFDHLQEALRRRHLLIVLDNFEQVVEAAPLVVNLLVAVSGLTAIVTSRVRLRVSGEHEYPVPPLGLPALDGRVAPETLAQSEAVCLFVERVRAVKPDFALTAENAAVVTEICRRLDGLPLAIELAACWIKMLPPSALLARLERRLPLLTGGGRDLPARQQTMLNTIAWSHSLLTPEEEVLFRRLAVFAGGFTPEAADSVVKRVVVGSLPAPPRLVDPSASVLDGLASLVDANLLRTIDAPSGEARFGMLETIRDYGLEQLEAAGEVATVRRRHAEHFFAFAQTATPRWYAPGARQLDHVDAEEANLRAALAWADEQHDAGTLLRFVNWLAPYWHFRGRFTEAQGWLERAVARSSASAGGQELADGLWWAGKFARIRGGRPLARERAEASLALARSIGDEAGAARSMILLSQVDQDEGDYVQERARAAEALAIFRRVGDAFWAAEATYILGYTSFRMGDLTEAESLLGEALSQARELGDVGGAATIASDLGEIARVRGDYARAAELYRERLGLAWDAWGTRWSLEGLAYIAAACGEAERAARLLGAAAAYRERLGVALAPASRPDHDASVASAKAALGEEAFAAAWTAGRRLTTDEARAEAAAVAIDWKLAPIQDLTETASHGLSPRELEVLRLIVEGQRDHEIAESLFLSRRTVTSHVTSILNKLGVTSRTAAAALAVRRGIV